MDKYILQQAIDLLKQTTEFEVLDSWKKKVADLELLAKSDEKTIDLADNKIINYYYKRLWRFTESILLSTKLPSEFKGNYEVILAEEVIKKIECGIY